MRRVIIQNIPNSITVIGGIAAIGLNILLWFKICPSSNPNIFYLVLFVWSTDLVDGFAACILNAKSRLGAFLDAVKDKFFDITMFAFVFKELWVQGINEIRPLIILILIGEGILIGINLFSRHKKVNISVHPTGKLKATFYFTSIGSWFYAQSHEILNLYFIKIPTTDFPRIIFFMLILGLIFAILSIWVYIRCYRLKKEREGELK